MSIYEGTIYHAETSVTLELALELIFCTLKQSRGMLLQHGRHLCDDILFVHGLPEQQYWQSKTFSNCNEQNILARTTSADPGKYLYFGFPLGVVRSARTCSMPEDVTVAGLTRCTNNRKAGGAAGHGLLSHASTAELRKRVDVRSR